MTLTRSKHLLGLALLLASMAVTTTAALPARAQEGPKANAKLDLDEVRRRFLLAPDDPFLQYALLQIASREGKLDQAIQAVEQPSTGFFGGGRQGRQAGADPFSTFSGALAIQESLQLDTMRGPGLGRRFQERAGRLSQPTPSKMSAPIGIEGKGPPVPPKLVPPPDVKSKTEPMPAPPIVAEIPLNQRLPLPVPPVPPKKFVDVKTLPGPEAKSHDWAKMLGDKKPDVGTLSLCVPQEFWFAEFSSLARVNELMAQGDVFGSHLLTQVLGDAHSSLATQRIKTQLGLVDLDPAVLKALDIEAVGITGSDLFLVEGSDITVLVQSRKVAALAKVIDGLGIGKTQTGEYLGVKYTYSSTPDRVRNVYSANPRPDLHVRSNSLPAFQRVMQTVLNKTPEGKPAMRLGESAEYRFIRTKMPRGAAEEDGLIYLSDAFIHHMVGAKLKIGESRRVLVYNHLKMIGHACLLFRTENGRAPKSLEQLAEAKCAPGVFGKGWLAHPDGGTYSLSEDGMTGIDSKYGTILNMAPCIEHPVTKVDEDEVADYSEFLTRYNEYWRTVFDPIVVRVALSEKRFRLETLILPLIDNSIYTEMARSITGPPRVLDTLPTTKREIGGLWMAFDRKPLLDWMGPERKIDPEAKNPAPSIRNRTARINELKQLGLAFHNYESAFQYFPPSAICDKQGKPLLSWRVAVLPFIEQENLYREFKLDEPWDSEHNKPLIAKMPKLYSAGSKTLQAAGKTTYLVPAGKGTISPTPDSKTGINKITDGTSNTIMVVEAAEASAAFWTKPDDLPFDPKEPFKGLLAKDQPSFLAAMCDGSVLSISAKVSPKSLASAFLMNDGQPLEEDWPNGKAKPREVMKPDGPKAASEYANDFRQLMLAMHGYHDANGQLPIALLSPKQKPLLSWRVAVLPYVEETDLYQQFKLDEPWDSEHNKPLIAKMPRIFQGTNAKLNADGKTQCALPAGKFAWATSPTAKVKFTDLTDALSNTIAVVRVDEESSVVWTKPEDFEIDPKDPVKHLTGISPNGILLALFDGTAVQVRRTTKSETLVAMFTPAGGDVANVEPSEFLPLPTARPTTGIRWAPQPLSESDFDDLLKYGLDVNKLRKFLRDGLGDQVGFHLHDNAPLFDSDWGGNSDSLGLGGPADIGVAMLIQFFTRPASISLPIRDTAVVDAFLKDLEKVYMNRNLDGQLGSGWRNKIVDLYSMQTAEKNTVYVMTVRFVGVKWRLYWTRIGGGLYIVNRPFILDDLAAAHADPLPVKKAEPAHLLLRIKPENWKEVLPSHLLGVVENERHATVKSLTMLDSVQGGWPSALKPGAQPDADLLTRVQRVYGVRAIHPEGGKFVLSKEGKGFESTLYGTPENPRQPVRPLPGTPGDRMDRGFGGLNAGLTFEEDGLRAVIVIQRK